MIRQVAQTSNIVMLFKWTPDYKIVIMEKTVLSVHVWWTGKRGSFLGVVS